MCSSYVHLHPFAVTEEASVNRKGLEFKGKGPLYVYV